MKQLLPLSLLILALVAVPVLAGQGRDETQQVTVFAERGEHATIELPPSSQRAGFELRGTVLDAGDRPVQDISLRIVRFEVDESDTVEGAAPGHERVPLRDLNAQVPPYSIMDTIPIITRQGGEFQIPRLAPGRYSLQVDWADVPKGTPFVRWNLEWVDHGPEEPTNG